jgi:hypothetical protein
LLIPYSENDALPALSHMPSEFRSYENYNNVYFCPQSGDGTVNLHLLQRHRVATLERMAPKEFSPPYSNIDLIRNPDVGMDVWTMLCRPEFKYYTKCMSLHCGKSVQFEVFRFRDIRSLLPNGELESFPDARSIEDIQINHANAEMFQGPQMCTICTFVIKMECPMSIMKHLIENHMDIIDKAFTCPTCLQVKFFTKNNFGKHFRKVHVPTLNLMPLVIESNLGHRIQFGFVFYMFIETMLMLNIPIPQLPENSPRINMYSAHGNIPVSKMRDAVFRMRYTNLPTLYRQEIQQYQDEQQQLLRPDESADDAVERVISTHYDEIDATVSTPQGIEVLKQIIETLPKQQEPSTSGTQVSTTQEKQPDILAQATEEIYTPTRILDDKMSMDETQPPDVEAYDPMYPGYSPVSPATPTDPLRMEPNESPVTTPELNDDDEEMPLNDKPDDKK